MKLGFTGVLFLILLTLKLIGYITWSWWWITAPLWGPSVIIIVLVYIVVVFHETLKW